MGHTRSFLAHLSRTAVQCETGLKTAQAATAADSSRRPGVTDPCSCTTPPATPAASRARTQQDTEAFIRQPVMAGSIDITTAAVAAAAVSLRSECWCCASINSHSSCRSSTCQLHGCALASAARQPAGSSYLQFVAGYVEVLQPDQAADGCRQQQHVCCRQH